LRAISLMYHGVVEASERESNGFSSPGAARYTLEGRLFEQHLSAFAEAGRSPSSVVELRGTRREGGPRGLRPLYLTFDDGGRSAVEIGERLSNAGWVGHFFIPVDFVGQAGFLDEAGVAALAAAGHVIGSHSSSHPVPMTRLSDDRLVEEWRKSVAVLGEITGTEIFAASVPGGYWSKRVVRAAASAGIEFVFVSDPVASVREIERCLVLGRYAVLAGTSPTAATRLARGELLPRLRQLAGWKLRAAAKAVNADAYLRLRKAILERR
jgi:peptidoglycan/xylan/chitin deacetylase (PgdA/CDA1 family)